MTSAALDDLPWGLLGGVGAAACSLLCGVVGLLLVGLLIWRARRRPAENPPELERSTRPLASPARLTGELGYVRTGESEYSRERWGRPLTYSCTLAEGAVWHVDAYGRRLLIREHPSSGALPPGLTLCETGDGALDLRFSVYAESPADARLLAEGELRSLLLSVGWLQLEANGQLVEMRDPRRQAQDIALTGLPQEGPEVVAAQLRLHDTVSDILVMLADRLS